MSTEKPTVGQIREKLGPRFERFFLKDVAEMLMQEAKGEFPPVIQEILDKKANNRPLNPSERREFDRARSSFWKGKFGVAFEGISEKSPETTQLKSDKRRAIILEKSNTNKIEKMQALHRAIKNLNEGEIVEEFRDETRRIIYFDEESQKYYILENDKPRFLEVADVLSDYAWGIKYVPDGEMIEPAYRNLAKRILTNETRRDLEKIYDQELFIEQKKVSTAPPREIAEKNWIEKKLKGDLGVIAEIMARELLARITTSQKLNFVVERVNAVEDSVYKYDFKIRSKVKLRGVGIGDENEINSRIKRLGFQFTTMRSLGHKKRALEEVKQLMSGVKLPVDDIVLCRIRTLEFGTAFDRWLAEGKPSGGPEQFLSAEIKDKLLEAVQDRLFEKGEGGEIYIH